jgi:hypothetical protein
MTPWAKVTTTIFWLPCGIARGKSSSHAPIVHNKSFLFLEIYESGIPCCMQPLKTYKIMYVPGAFWVLERKFSSKDFKTTEKYPVCCITSFIFSIVIMTKLTYIIEEVEIHMCAKFHFLKPASTRAMSAQSRLFKLISFCITHHLLRVPRSPKVFSNNFWYRQPFFMIYNLFERAGLGKMYYRIGDDLWSL